uniref:Vomeronasal type-1 receptor n=1 Tax=Capra hircus TaxID=9925 RepID=A0A8C2QZL4_CAPHI
MATRDFVVELIFLSQNIFGILGNFSFLYHYLFLHFTGLRSTELIIEYLLIANSLVMLSTGTPRTMEAFGWKYFLSDTECKIVYYIHRMARGVSIGSICLLRVCQAITISPRNSRWGQLKMKAPTHIGSTIFLCWVVHMLINIRFTRYVKDHWSNRNITKKKDLGLCYGLIHNRIKVLLNVGWLLLPAVSCLVLTIWSSVSMVFILDSHKQRVQYVHRTSISSRSSPKPRATQSIPVLVSTFVSFWWLVTFAAPITACFPTVSPYTLISHGCRVPSLKMACCGDLANSG